MNGPSFNSAALIIRLDKMLYRLNRGKFIRAFYPALPHYPGHFRFES